MPVSSLADEHPKLPPDPDGPAERRRPLRLDAVALVAVGGSVGTLARYGLSLLLPTHAESWPWGTFLANLSGAFALGALLEWLTRCGPDDGWRQRIRLLLGTGFCGGLTTYSTLAVEADLLVRSRHDRLAVAYLVVTLLAGLLATIGGIAAATGHHRLRQRGDAA
jgi:CrcB protein